MSHAFRCGPPVTRNPGGRRPVSCTLPTLRTLRILRQRSPPGAHPDAVEADKRASRCQMVRCIQTPTAAAYRGLRQRRRNVHGPRSIRRPDPATATGARLTPSRRQPGRRLACADWIRPRGRRKETPQAEEESVRQIAGQVSQRQGVLSGQDRPRLRQQRQGRAMPRRRQWVLPPARRVRLQRQLRLLRRQHRLQRRGPVPHPVLKRQPVPAHGSQIATSIP